LGDVDLIVDVVVNVEDLAVVGVLVLAVVPPGAAGAVGGGGA
jgi:hypothetical protein